MGRDGGSQGFQKYILFQKCHFVSVWAGVERLGTGNIELPIGSGGPEVDIFLLFSISALSKSAKIGGGKTIDPGTPHPPIIDPPGN